MENVGYDGDADERTLQQAVKLYEERLDLIADWLVRRAQRLVRSFRQERKRLQDEATAKAASRATGSRNARQLYSPLTPFARYHRRSLEICWQNVHHTRHAKKGKFYYIKKNQRGDYNLQILVAKAKPYEVDLVHWTESEAAVLRRRWRAVISFRRAIRELESSIRLGS